ncbi:MAG: RNB domain-containing ribonuclease [Phascolarctobacterium faecium]
MAGKPEERLVSTVALRSLKQAVYQTENIGHFGLAAEYYTHFTSPIRRYPDLIVHRLLHEWVSDPAMNAQKSEKLELNLDAIAEHSSIRERAAAEAERATVDLKKAEYMAGHIGEEFDGVISGVTAFGMFIELENGVEGLVHISSLMDDYEFYEDRCPARCIHGRSTVWVTRCGSRSYRSILPTGTSTLLWPVRTMLCATGSRPSF